MRYPDGGGLTAVQRVRRKRLRYQAAEMFAAGVRPPQVARALRVSRKSAYAWCAAWREGGTDALRSKGPSGVASRMKPAWLACALEQGPAAHGWTEEQRWTLARVSVLVARRFHGGRVGAGAPPAQGPHLEAAHQQRGGKIVLVWDNSTQHTDALMRELLAARRRWLTVFRLPANAPDLNPAEGVWANLKNYLGNLAACIVDALADLTRTRLKKLQYRSDLLDGFIAETGLTWTLP